MKASEVIETYGDLSAAGNTELLAALVGEDAARRLVEEHGSLITKLADLPVSRLQATKGIGLKKAATLKAVLELSKRMMMEHRVGVKGSTVTCAADAYERLRFSMAKKVQESFVVVALNVRHRILCIKEVAKGTVHSVEVHPREVFAPAIEARASAVILAHNHPSGDVNLSDEDKNLTMRMVKAGEMLGIPVIDHIVIGGHSYESLAERGVI